VRRVLDSVLVEAGDVKHGNYVGTSPFLPHSR